MTKKLFLCSLVLILILSVNTNAQNFRDLIVIDEIAENVLELKSQNRLNNVFHTNGIKENAITQISGALQKGQVETLHIHAATKPGAIVFNSIAITAENVDYFSEELKQWKMYISKKVSIHSDIVFEEESGRALKQKLESITGLVFESENK